MSTDSEIARRQENLVCLIDAFDSFVYVIDQYLSELGVPTVVLRSAPGNIAALERYAPSAIVLGPGPGTPEDSGHVELVREFAGRTPLFGVCLGHQAIGAACGRQVVRAANIMHGKRSKISHDGNGVYRDLPETLLVTRYHSLIVADDDARDSLIVTARSHDDKYIMGLRHPIHAIESVQFHPESIGTDHGLKMIRNFLTTAGIRPGEGET